MPYLYGKFLVDKGDLLKIKEALSKSGLMKKAVAEKCGITPVYLSYILNMKRDLPYWLRQKLFSVLEIEKPSEEDEGIR